MSQTNVTVGSASVAVDALFDSKSQSGTTPRYQSEDVVHAAAATLVAIGGPDATAWSAALRELVAR